MLTSEVFVPRPRDEVFAFFSNASNLEILTPPWVNFQILTPTPIEMNVGTLIDYRIRIRGIWLTWRTRILLWDPPRGFVDEQIRGPYKVWHHEHAFEERKGGTLCRDFVEYRAPFAWLTHPLVIDRDVRHIFEHRKRKLLEIFPETAPPAAA